MFDAWVAVHFVGQRVEIPGLAASLAVVLAAKIENLVLECFVAVPAVRGEDTAVFQRYSVFAFVDPNKGDIIWPITKFSCAVECADGDPRKPC